MINNVVSLCKYRLQRYPTHNEIIEHLQQMAQTLDPLTPQVALSLLELYEADMLQVTRACNGEFLYALREESEGRGPCEVQNISDQPKHN